MMIRTWVLAAAIAATGASGAAAQTVPVVNVNPSEVLSKEPKKGSLRPFQIVFVDDGRCPRGQITEITGGTNRDRFGNRIPGTPRKYRCVVPAD